MPHDLASSLARLTSRALPGRRWIGPVGLAALLLGAASCAEGLAVERPTAIAPELGGGPMVKTIDLVQTPGRISPQRLVLPAGRYVFRVRNEDVPHAVGIHLARMTPDHGIGEEVPGARLETPVGPGQSGSTAAVDLAPGKYSYRCERNPTPHYFLTVE